jgi:hypothetical protein
MILINNERTYRERWIIALDNDQWIYEGKVDLIRLNQYVNFFKNGAGI